MKKAEENIYKTPATIAFRLSIFILYRYSHFSPRLLPSLPAFDHHTDVMFGSTGSTEIRTRRVKFGTLSVSSKSPSDSSLSPPNPSFSGLLPLGNSASRIATSWMYLVQNRVKSSPLTVVRLQATLRLSRPLPACKIRTRN